jgi:pimeloyl-ACP methyl ester carboxylesterase
MVFLHGRCAHAQGYVQAFQFAAATRGSVVAPQGDIACEGAYRRWNVDPVLQDRRIEAAFRAAGDAGPLEDMVVIGYSQGEVLAEQLAERFPSRYTRAVLMGAPAVPSVTRLRRLRACVMVSGERDARDLMKEGARRLQAAGVPSTYVEMPRALHNQMIEGERTMEEVFGWLDTQQR